MLKQEKKESTFDINQDIVEREANETVQNEEKKKSNKLRIGSALLIVVAVMLAFVYEMTVITGRLTQIKSTDKEEIAKQQASEVKISKAKVNDAEDDMYITSSGLLVGDTVKYIPPDATADLLKEYTGANASKEVNNKKTGLQIANAEDFYMDEWEVLSITEDGMVELISKSGTSATIELRGETGYKYAAKFLNLVANILYGDSTRDITARSVTLEDLVKRVKAKSLENTNIRISGNTYIVDENYNLALEKSDFIDSIYYDILLDDPNLVDTFWLATTCKTDNKLKMFFVGNRELSTYTLYNGVKNAGVSLSLRPVIKVSEDLIKKDANNNWVIR